MPFRFIHFGSDHLDKFQHRDKRWEKSTGTGWRDYVYLGDAPLAEYRNSTTYFVHTDHLGSTRLLTAYPTASVAECDDYYPFGESISCGGTSTDPHKFTGYERDTESNLDNAHARYVSSTLGRFMSPDPAGNAIADPTNPQSWNLYAYANNNPVRFIDPTGLDGCEWSGAAICAADANAGQYSDLGGGGPDFSAVWGASYTMDGVSLPANVVSGALGADAADECPNEMCSFWGTDTNGNMKYWQFYSFAGGATGFFNPGDVATRGVNEFAGFVWSNDRSSPSEQETRAIALGSKIALASSRNSLSADCPCIHAPP